MKTESPYADSVGRRIVESDIIEAKYGYRYTVCFDRTGGWTAVDNSGHNRIDLGRVAPFCSVVGRSGECP